MLTVATDTNNPSIIFAKAGGASIVRFYAMQEAGAEYGGAWIRVWRDADNRRDFKFLPDGTFAAPIAIQEGNTLLSNKYLQLARVLCYKTASIAVAAGSVGTISVPNSMGLAPTVVVATPTSNKLGVACSVAASPTADKFNVYIENGSSAQVTIAANVLAIYKP